MLDLRSCTRGFFSSCDKQGLLFVAVHGLLTACGVQTLRGRASVALAHGPSRFSACGILPDQGSDPCFPHWQMDSLPLGRWGSPLFLSLNWGEEC